jgi:hypothetical protein
MSIELVGTGSSANRVLVSQLPALIGPDTLGQSANEDFDPSYLCLIAQVADEVVVWDLSGQRSTSVNGSPVAHATLKDSDTLRLGGAEFRVHSGAPRRRYLHGVRN